MAIKEKRLIEEIAEKRASNLLTRRQIDMVLQRRRMIERQIRYAKVAIANIRVLSQAAQIAQDSPSKYLPMIYELADAELSKEWPEPTT